MSAPHIILDDLPSVCQKLLDLVEAWRSYNKHNFACFLRHGVQTCKLWNSEGGRRWVIREWFWLLWCGLWWTLEMRRAVNIWYDVEYAFPVASASIFTARCTLVQSAVLRSHVVCLSVCPSVTLVNCDDIGWNSSKIISPSVSLGRSLFATPTWRFCSKGNTLHLGQKSPTPCWFERRRHSIANCGRMVTDSATVTMESL